MGYIEVVGGGREGEVGGACVDDEGEGAGVGEAVVEGDVAVGVARQVADQEIHPKPSGQGRVASLASHLAGDFLTQGATQEPPLWG